jgi:hypothetical protein
MDKDQKRAIGRSRCVVEDLLVVGVGDFLIFERGHVCGVEVEFEAGVGIGLVLYLYLTC